MGHRCKLEAEDYTYRDVTGFNISFGGESVFFIGSFWQIISVVQMQNRSQMVETCFKQSLLYLLFDKLPHQELMKSLSLKKGIKDDPPILHFPSFS